MLSNWKRVAHSGLPALLMLLLSGLPASAQTGKDPCVQGVSLSTHVEASFADSPVLQKLHRVVLRNEVDEGFQPDYCRSLIKAQPGAKFGFAQFDLSDEADRKLLRQLLSNTAGGIDEKTSALLSGRIDPNSPEGQSSILQASEAIRYALTTEPSRGDFVAAYRAKLEKRIARVKPLYDAMVRSNPNLGHGSVAEFILIYADEARWLLGDLDDFTALIEGSVRYVCNLLCRARLQPAFRIAEKATALDLPRYIHTSTCFGFALESQEGIHFLRRLENIIAAVAITPEEILLLNTPGAIAPTQFDSYFARFDLHDLGGVGSRGPALKLQELKLRVAPFIKGPDTTVRRSRPVEAIIVEAASTACQNATGPGWQLLRAKNQPQFEPSVLYAKL